MMLIFGHFELWAVEFRLLHYLLANDINRNLISETEKFNIEEFSYILLKYLKSTLIFSYKGIRRINGADDYQQISTFI
jgi:hypothetical protein